jgi:GntR family transcriptional regulator
VNLLVAAPLNRYSAEPLYVQLKNIIEERIESGEWKPNSMIPSENELSSMYKISRMTARSVITQLVNEGMLYRIHGKGTFVCQEKIVMSALTYQGIRSQLEEKGYMVETQLLNVNRIKCNALVAQKLSLEQGAMVYDIQRKRSADGIPISYHRSFVPIRLCKNLEKFDLQNEQLCEILSKHYGLIRSRVTETLETYLADAEKAKILEVKRAFPLILLQNRIAGATGLTFEYSRIYFRGDKITIRLEYDSRE